MTGYKLNQKTGKQTTILIYYSMHTTLFTFKWTKM